MRRWWVVGEEERRPGQRHRAADSRQRRAEERWQPAAAGRQMPAARLTRWRSGRSSFRASADLRAHRASAIKVAVPGETGRGARHCPADLQLPPRTAELRRRGGWCAPASAQPCARGPELVQHGRLPVWISGRAGWGHRAPAGGAQRHLRAAFARPSPPRRRRNARHLLRRFLCYKRACRTARGHGYGWLINLPSAAPQ